MDTSGGCIVKHECVSRRNQYVVIVDECVPPGIAKRITQELRSRIAEVIAVIRSTMKGWNDQKIGKKLLRQLCEEAEKVFIIVTGDRHFRRSARLKKERHRVRIVFVGIQVRDADVWGSVGARIIGDVKNMLNQLETAV